MPSEEKKAPSNENEEKVDRRTLKQCPAQIGQTILFKDGEEQGSRHQMTRCSKKEGHPRAHYAPAKDGNKAIVWA